MTGIIPARAGFTIMRLLMRPSIKDHPRSRGVYVRTEISSVLHFADHPRSRGVYTLTCFSSPELTGSSPLARGLQIIPARCAGPNGIIPARAGFTHGDTGPVGQVTDHPRSRGVYPVLPAELVHAPGSSPLARGLRRVRGRGGCRR